MSFRSTHNHSRKNPATFQPPTVSYNEIGEPDDWQKPFSCCATSLTYANVWTPRSTPSYRQSIRFLEQVRRQQLQGWTPFKNRLPFFAQALTRDKEAVILSGCGDVQPTSPPYLQPSLPTTVRVFLSLEAIPKSHHTLFLLICRSSGPRLQTELQNKMQAKPNKRHLVYSDAACRYRTHEPFSGHP